MIGAPRVDGRVRVPRRALDPIIGRSAEGIQGAPGLRLARRQQAGSDCEGSGVRCRDSFDASNRPAHQGIVRRPPFALNRLVQAGLPGCAQVCARVIAVRSDRAARPAACMANFQQSPHTPSDLSRLICAKPCRKISREGYACGSPRRRKPGRTTVGDHHRRRDMDDCRRQSLGVFLNRAFAARGPDLLLADQHSLGLRDDPIHGLPGSPPGAGDRPTIDARRPGAGPAGRLGNSAPEAPP